MKYVSISDVIECNAYLKANEWKYQVHLRDACGKQSCWVEGLKENTGKDDFEEVDRILTGFFRERGFILEFDEDKKNFWIAQN